MIAASASSGRRCRYSTNSPSKLDWKNVTSRSRSTRVALDLHLELVQRHAAVVLRVAPVEDVEVDAVQDLDAVPHRQLLHGGPDPIRIDAAGPCAARRARGEGRSRRPPRSASCRARRASSTASTSTAGVERASAGRGSRGCPATSSRSSRGVGEPQRREQAEADRLAVAVALVAGRGLDRVADGVARG